MYQLLQVLVYASFSFFDNFLSRSIKVGQSSSRRRRRDVAETSRRRRRNISSIIWSRAGLRDVSETSRRRLPPRKHIKLLRHRRDVSETNSRLEKVSKESQKKSNMFDFTATPSRPAKSPGDVASTSPRPTETRVANRSPTSVHASEIGALVLHFSHNNLSI